jgi:hypothetical protein
MTWLTTMDDLIADPLGAIWLTPRAYRDDLEDTLGITEQEQPTPLHRRQPGRGGSVEVNIAKQRLLEVAKPADADYQVDQPPAAN